MNLEERKYREVLETTLGATARAIASAAGRSRLEVIEDMAGWAGRTKSKEKPMRTFYAVTTSTVCPVAAVICERHEDALVIAERVNYLKEGETPEKYVYEVPLIGAQG